MTTPLECFNGLDNNVDLSSVADCLVNEGYVFVLRYLGGPCYNAGIPLTSAEVQALTQAGLMVGTIYSGANNVAEFSCGVQTFTQGQLDGMTTLELAQSVGQPMGSAIYLDLQGGQIGPECEWLSYVEGWTSTIQAHDYLPGVYSSPPQVDIINTQPFGGSALLYWVAQWITVGPLVTYLHPVLLLN